MIPPATVGASFSVVLPDEQANARLAVDVANALKPGVTWSRCRAISALARPPSLAP